MSSDWVDFVSRNYFVAAYVIALFISIWSYKKYFDTPLKYFPIIIAYTLFNELLGYFIRYSEDYAFFSSIQDANGIIYNVHNIIFYIFFHYVYMELIKNLKFKKYIRLSAVLLLVSYLVNALFFDPFIQILFYASAFGSCTIVFITILYFINNAKWKWVYEKYNLMTWISLGLLSFYSIFPIIYLVGFTNTDIWYSLKLGKIIHILIFTMYVLFSIGFIFSRRRAFR